MEYSHIAPILGQLWSPIAAVSSHWDGKDNAQICVSIGGASIVPERPRVLVQIYKTNHSHEMITKSGAFALNFPRAGQLDWRQERRAARCSRTVGGGWIAWWSTQWTAGT